MRRARCSRGRPRAIRWRIPHPGWAEQDPDDWERALRTVIGSVASQVGADRVAAIGIAGQVDGIVPVDASGEALGPGIIWMDRRATTEAAALAARFDARDVHARTGVNIDASHGGPKIAWLAGPGAGDRVADPPTGT